MQEEKMCNYSNIAPGRNHAALAPCSRNAAALVLFLLSALTSAAQTSVLTYHYDNSRTGQDTNETTLTLSNVNTNQFGKLFSQPVDGYLYAQPLYVPNLAIPGKGTHNVVFVATEGDSVYAFDADNNSGSNASPLWRASLLDTAHGAAAGARTVDSSIDIGCGDLIPQIGITSTPVIDFGTGTMYVEAKSKENGAFVHRLHALDITTGAEKSPGPVVINAAVKGRGDGSSNDSLPFDSLHQNNRPGLLLVNGNIYIGFASHCDFGPYHGWVFAYEAATFSQKGVFVSTPDGGLGGFWMSGAGLAADTNGNIFAATGNGTFDAGHIPATQFGDTILKLALSGGKLSVVDYFTPFNQGRLNLFDIDLGSGGVLLLPDQPGTHPHLLLQAGKEGRIYLVDRDQMTAGNLHFCRTCATGRKDTQIVQEIPNALGGMWSMPAYWNGSVYFWGSGDVLKAYSLTNGMLSVSPSSTSTDSYGFPGAIPTISANGNTNGIVWSLKTDAYNSNGSSVLRAHNAGNVADMLYSSDQNSGRDDPAGAVKFSVPTVMNGKVYVGAAGRLSVYGLLK
jgi:hypothetical protein